MENAWLARRDYGQLFGYFELVPPSEKVRGERRAKMTRIGRLLLVIGILFNAFTVLPGIVAGVVMDALVPIVVLVLFSAGCWVVAVLIWRALVKRVLSRPMKVKRSISDYKRARTPRAPKGPKDYRIEGDLELPA